MRWQGLDGLEVFQGQALDVLDGPCAALHGLIDVDLIPGKVDVFPEEGGGLPRALKERVAFVGQQGESAVEGRRAAIAFMIVHHGAARHAAAAGDAVRGHADVHPVFVVRLDDVGLGAFFKRFEEGQGFFVLGEKRAHVHHQILDDREVVQRPQGDVLARGQVADVGFAGQALATVDDHAAGAAHVHAAGEAEGNAWVLFLLDAQQHVQNSGGVGIWDFQRVALKAPVSALFGVVAEYPYRARIA